MEIMTIDKIQALTENQAKTLALESCKIKGHDIYFVDFKLDFGFSALVFLNGAHLYYANEYQLHYRYKEREELKDLFVRKLEEKLFTEDELSEDLADYGQYCRKSYYLHSYYGMQKPYVSVFRISYNNRKTKEDIEYRRRTSKMFFNPVCFAYYNDKDFVQKCKDLSKALNKALNAKKDDFDFWKGAFKYEMYNHEYTYSYSDFEVLSAFGNIHSDDDYFDQLGFNDIQRNAYIAAKKEVLRLA